MLSALAGGLGILATACWFVTATFPLSAAPQNDAAGVTIKLGGAAVLHRAPVAYPDAARAKGVQGDVVVEVKLDSAGNVSDAHVVSGPDELRRPALESVLEWHFTRDSAGQTRQVTIGFHMAASATPTAANPANSTARAASPAALIGHAVRMVAFIGMPEDQQNDLKARLPVHENDTLTSELLEQTTAVVKDYDEHFRVAALPAKDGGALIAIMGPGSSNDRGIPVAAMGFATPPERIKIGGNVQQTKLISQTRPLYPPDAKAARIQGKVELQAVIAKDGTVKSLEVISGHPLLVPSAMEAVKQWVYQTTLLNGNPVEVVTQIDVNYTLSQ